jgi:hypothetical protein
MRAFGETFFDVGGVVQMCSCWAPFILACFVSSGELDFKINIILVRFTYSSHLKNFKLLKKRF